MQFDTERLKNLDQDEWHTYMSTTSTRVFGLRMQQIPYALLKVNQLLNQEKFDQIIEIGAGDGGLSCLLALHSRVNKTKFHSFDIHDKGENIGLLRELTNGFEVRDVIFKEENVQYVAELIKNGGKTLCIFDAGKFVEGNIYFKYMKSNDFCILHDFARDEETFKNQVKGRIWNWLECTYAQIQDEADKNNIVFCPDFENVVWAVGYKK
jgi:hypothetical protein